MIYNINSVIKMKKGSTKDESKDLDNISVGQSSQSLMSRTEKMAAKAESKNFFQYFFEKALGPKEEKKKEERVRVKKPEKSKVDVPKISYNPVIAAMGAQPKGVNWEKEIVALPNSLLKIDNNHLSLNKLLNNKELLSK